jgi:hypothetical protein
MEFPLCKANICDIKMRIILDLVDLHYQRRDFTIIESILRSSLNWFDQLSRDEDNANVTSYKRVLQILFTSISLRNYYTDGTKHSLLFGNAMYTTNTKINECQVFSWPALISNNVETHWGHNQTQHVYIYKHCKLPQPYKENAMRIEETYQKLKESIQRAGVGQNIPEFSNEAIVHEIVTKEDTKPKKKIVKEDEDLKWKKEMLMDLQTFFVRFNPIEKFTVLVNGLKMICGLPNRIKFAAKGTEKNDFMIQTLIEMADAMASVGTVPKEKRQHFEKEEEQQKYKFNEQDLVDYSAILFHLKQWKRLEVVGIHINSYGLIGKSYERLSLFYSLLKASVKFIMSRQIDRKVFFEPESFEIATTKDSCGQLFDLTDQIKINLLELCGIIIKCLKDNKFLEYHCEMAFDSIFLIWSFLEPLIRNLEKQNYFAGFQKENPILLTLELLHCLITTTSYGTKPEHCIMGIGISQKLVLINECLELYDKSCKILEELLSNIECIRQHYCGADPIDFASADILFINPTWAKNPSENFRKYRKKLGCIHTDVQNAWYRCQINYFKKQQEVGLNQKLQESLKQNHTRIQIPKELIHKDDQRVRRWCGTDPVRMALFYLSVIQNGEGISTAEKKKLLKLCETLLNEGKELEYHSCARLVMSNTIGLSLLQKSNHSATIYFEKRESESNFSVCCKLLTSRTDGCSSDVCGSGLKLDCPRNAIISLSGFLPNEKYMLFSSYDCGQGPKKSEIIPFCTSLPLSLPLCWAYLFGVALQYDLEVANYARHILEDFFILSKCADDLLITYQAQNSEHHNLYSINHTNLQNTDPSIIRGYVQSLFRSIEKEEQKFYNSEDSKNILSAQILRLRFNRDLLVAAECSKECGIPTLELLCVLKIFEQLQPFLDNDELSPVVIHMLLHCYQTLIRASTCFEEDRPKGLGDYLVPVSYRLIKYFLQKGNGDMAVKIASETTCLIHTSVHVINNRILNSSQFESSVLGLSFKPEKGKAKRGSAQYLLEFGFHGMLALTKTPKLGLTPSRKLFDMFYEQIELLLAKSKLNLDFSDAGERKNNRKVFDNSTSLRELYNMFSSAGPESTFHELGRFKKNSRYIELVSELATWCYENDNPDAVLRIATETGDWIDKRTQIILRMNELLEDSVSRKKDIVIKRRRRSLFDLHTAAHIEAFKQTLL